MKNRDFTTAISVDQTPDEVFAAINDVRAWWSGAIEGDTANLGDEFTYRYKDVHYSKQKVTELVPGRKVVWHVVESRLSFVEEQSEWTGTDIVFEIAERAGKTELRFTHVGLVPRFECFEDCSTGWTSLVQGNLCELIATRVPQPDVFAAEVR